MMAAAAGLWLAGAGSAPTSGQDESVARPSTNLDAPPLRFPFLHDQLLVFLSPNLSLVHVQNFLY